MGCISFESNGTSNAASTRAKVSPSSYRAAYRWPDSMRSPPGVAACEPVPDDAVERRIWLTAESNQERALGRSRAVGARRRCCNDPPVGFATRGWQGLPGEARVWAAVWRALRVRSVGTRSDHRPGCDQSGWPAVSSTAASSFRPVCPPSTIVGCSSDATLPESEFP